MDKLLVLTTVSKNKTVSSSSESDDDCDTKCKQGIIIKVNFKNPVPYRFKPQCFLNVLVILKNFLT